MLSSIAACQDQKPVVPTVLPIEQVVGHPEAYSHKIVTVTGCFQMGFERCTIQPCGAYKHEQVVWIEDAEALVTLRNQRLNNPSIPIPKELQSERVIPDEFVFKYDEAKSRSAAIKLSRAAGKQPRRVTIIGQFDTIAPKQANTSPTDFGHGFGHLGQYQHRLILVDVVDASKQQIPAQSRVPDGALVKTKWGTSYRPYQGFVPDEKTAVRLAVALLEPVYGAEKINSERPFTASLKDGVWTVRGTLPHGYVGGTAVVKLSKADGRVLLLIHEM